MAHRTLLTDVTDGIGTLTLNRPERLNAYTTEMGDEVTEVLRAWRDQAAVRAVILTGAGRGFCAGVDLEHLKAHQAGGNASTGPRLGEEDFLRKLPLELAAYPKPLIAAVNGMACGGAFYLLGEAEFLVADPAATFFDPHTSYGMVSAFESILMAQCMPYGEATRMALLGTAERMSARRAHEVGLVSEVTEPGESVAAAVRCAEIVAACPTEAVQGTVRACWAARRTWTGPT